MNEGVLARGAVVPLPVLARALPFAAFIVLMALEPWLARQFGGEIDSRWLYGVRAALVSGLMLMYWRHYSELACVRRPTAREVLLASGIGLGVLAVWLVLDSGIFVLGQSGSGFDPRAVDGRLDWSLALMRLAGSALVVPVMEELFWRSLIMRWLEEADFVGIAPMRVGLRALVLSSFAFGFEHSQWLAGIVAGLAYGWLYIRSGNLWVAVLAHALTNAGLGVWVLATGAWYFW